MKLASNHADRKKDPTCIDYDTHMDLVETERFHQLVVQELKLRKLYRALHRAPLPVKRNALRQRLVLEEKALYLEDQVELSAEDTLILVEEAIPCVLHMRNRIGEKIMKEIVREAIASCNGGYMAEVYTAEIPACMQHGLGNPTFS